MYVLAHMCSYVCVSANAGSTDRVTVGLKRPSCFSKTVKATGIL